MLMIEFKRIDDETLIHRHSFYVFATAKVLGYCNEHGSISLTAKKNFNRKFVDWAVDAFEWPQYTRENLYAVNKTLNEIDLPPLGFIHEMLTALKLGRHYKGKFQLTRKGKELTQDLPHLFEIVAPFFLFRFDHLAFSRGKTVPMDNWDIFLNVLNVEAKIPRTGQELYAQFFEVNDDEQGVFSSAEKTSFYAGILRPLCWIGLLEEIEIANNYFADRLFVKTPLWEAALQLDTDHMLA